PPHHPAYTPRPPPTPRPSHPLSLTDPSAPSSADTAPGFQYRFSCDNGTSWSLWSSTASASCSTNDNGTRHVKGEIRDQDLGVRTYSADVTVNNVADRKSVVEGRRVDDGSQRSIDKTNQG